MDVHWTLGVFWNKLMNEPIVCRLCMVRNGEIKKILRYFFTLKLFFLHCRFYYLSKGIQGMLGVFLDLYNIDRNHHF